jgi:hypothetical protein
MSIRKRMNLQAPTADDLAGEPLVVLARPSSAIRA